MTADNLCACGCEQILTGRQKKYAGAPCAKRAGRASWLMKTYSITLEEYDKILEEQGGLCPICMKPPKEGKNLVVDHEHGGHVRGLVCSYDNLHVIRKLKSPDVAHRLADYLERPPAERALGERRIAPGRAKGKRRGTPRLPRGKRR